MTPAAFAAVRRPVAPLIRLRPAARLAILVLAVVTCYMLPPPAVVVWLALLVGFLAWAGLRPRGLWTLAKPWLWLALLVVGIHTVTTVSAAELGHPSWAGVLAGLVAVARVASTLLCLAVYLAGSDLVDLVAGLTWWLRPLRRFGVDAPQVGLVLAVALGTVPRVLADGRRLDAVTRLRRSAREVEGAAGSRITGWWRRTLDRAHLVVPLLEGLFRRADGLTLALVGRLPRSDLPCARPRAAEFALLVTWLAALIVPVAI